MGLRGIPIRSGISKQTFSAISDQNSGITIQRTTAKLINNRFFSVFNVPCKLFHLLIDLSQSNATDVKGDFRSELRGHIFHNRYVRQLRVIINHRETCRPTRRIIDRTRQAVAGRSTHPSTGRLHAQSSTFIFLTPARCS